MVPLLGRPANTRLDAHQPMSLRASGMTQLGLLAMLQTSSMGWSEPPVPS